MRTDHRQPFLSSHLLSASTPQCEWQVLLSACMRAHAHTDYLSEDEKVLRAFDLSSKYGPCTGMTRLQR